MKYKEIFSKTPGHTSVIKHDIVLTSPLPAKRKIYPVPVHLQKYFDEEVDKLSELGIIGGSLAESCSPVVLVQKPDSSYRMTIDFRAINSVTKFDAEPACNAENDLHKFHGSKFYSELDLTKAYYQIELTDKAKPMTNRI